MIKQENIDTKIKNIIQNLEDRKTNVNRFKENLYKLFSIITDLIPDKMSGEKYPVDAVITWWDGKNWVTNSQNEPTVYMRIYRGELGLWMCPYIDMSEFNRIDIDEIDYINVDNAIEAVSYILSDLEAISTYKENADAVAHIVKQFEEIIKNHYGKNTQ